MATTKTSLISTIYGYITAIIDEIDVRNAYLELINTFFSTTITKSNTAGANQYTYNLKFNKKGNMVTCTGFIRNDYAIIRGNEICFTQTDTELYAKTGQDTVTSGVLFPSNGNCRISFATNTIYLLDSMSSGATLNINTTYQVND